MKKLILSTIILLMLTTLTAFSMNDDLLNMEFPDIPEIEMPEEETEYDCDCTCEEQPIITESIGFEDPKGSSVQNDVSTQYDVTIYTEDDFIIAKTSSRQLGKVSVGSDAVDLFKKAIDAVPDGGSLYIDSGKYLLSAKHKFALNPDGSNIFYTCFPVLDKAMRIYGAGEDKTIIQMMPGQRSPDRHVALMLIRATKAYDLGYEDFEVAYLTLDGNRAKQTDGQPHDGEGLILVGSLRTNGNYHNLKLLNSWGSGIYLGNNGSGSGTDEIVSNIYSENCGAEAIILDTCHNSQVRDSESWNCREGLVLYGNDDFRERSKDGISASNIRTDSQVTVWQVNDFIIENLNMDCTKTTGSYGFMVRDGTGTIKDSTLKSNKNRHDSTGGATYLIEQAHVTFDNCVIEGYYGIHAIGQSYAEVKNCKLVTTGGCYVTVDPFNPVSSTIKVSNSKCSGKKSDIQAGSNLIEI
jgi:hypothetical protein